MWQFYIIIYFLILGLLIRVGNIGSIIFFLSLGIMFLLIIPFIIKAERIKIQIKLKEVINNTSNTPFVNINKAPWYIFDELPGFNRVSAKKAVWLREQNHGYSSLESFYELNKISSQDRQILKNILFI